MKKFCGFKKYRAKWLSCDDRNTSYFHNCMISRRKCNRIEGLKLEMNGVLMTMN